MIVTPSITGILKKRLSLNLGEDIIPISTEISSFN